MAASRFCALHTMSDIKEILSIVGRFYADDRGSEIKPGYVMGWTVNNFTLGRSVGIIV